MAAIGTRDLHGPGGPGRAEPENVYFYTGRAEPEASRAEPGQALNLTGQPSKDKN